MEKARRRRRVPAFGEWNYYHHSGELSTPAPAPAAAAEWYAPARDTAEACSDAWFKYSPPPRKPQPPPPPRRKARRQETTDKSYSGGRRRVQGAATSPARASDAGASKAARVPAKTAAARVVRSVDADLYQVPPPEFEPDEPGRRRKTASGSSWMACLGFRCCVA